MSSIEDSGCQIFLFLFALCFSFIGWGTSRECSKNNKALANNQSAVGTIPRKP